MSTTVRHRSPTKRHLPSPIRRRSPTKRELPSPIRRRSPAKRELPSPPRRRHGERSPEHHRTFARDESPVRNSSSHKTRPLVKEDLHDGSRSFKDMGSRNSIKEKVPEHTRPPRQRESKSPTREKPQRRSRSPGRRLRSPIQTDKSRSPSPRTKRLRNAEASRDSERSLDRETAKHTRKNDKEWEKQQSGGRDAIEDGRTGRERVDRGSSRLPRHRSNSPEERNHRSRHGSRSPSATTRTHARDEERSSRGSGHSRADEEEAVLRMNAAQEALEAKEKQKPSFELSGKLAEETNRVRGVTLLFTEPPDARKPDIKWRFYVFKGGDMLKDPLYIHRQSCYLFGRERRVADIPTDHPSCSKQHAVLQYRLVEKEQLDGMMKKQVRPYLMDLGSTNGTFINDNRLEPQRYYELFEKDTIKFGNSSREYVMLNEDSAK